ncbi:DUF4276 family protein [Candidatus Poribacteria bacterium]|nr:DUF4276 family protein [Candidatus Poribacteria bacterium]MYF55977.1 DUF4276 family protein [Candidatus Poribacteria bacterium]MYI93942.1 DUF4276 family protein [Candidatus Poribacteria bacterium]
MSLKIGCIVEGQGDVAALPVLIRRIAAECYPEMAIHIPRPIRVNRNQVVLPDQLEQEVELAARRIDGNGAIFIILDSDDDCPAQLGPELLYRASQVHDNLPIAVVLAKRELESWFLAAAESLRGKRGLKTDINSPDNPEIIRGAKEWLRRRMQTGKTYRETTDQPALAAQFDLQQARQADSFDKCYREIVRLLEELQTVNDTTSNTISN